MLWLLFVALVTGQTTVNPYCSNNTCWLWSGNTPPYHLLSTFLDASSGCGPGCTLNLVPSCYVNTKHTRESYQNNQVSCNSAVSQIFGVNELPPSFMSFFGDASFDQETGNCPTTFPLATNPDATENCANSTFTSTNEQDMTQTTVWIGPLTITTPGLTIVGLFSTVINFAALAADVMRCDLFRVQAPGVNFKNLKFITTDQCKITGIDAIVYRVGGGSVGLSNLDMGDGSVVFQMPPNSLATDVSIAQVESTGPYAVKLVGLDSGSVTVTDSSSVFHLGRALINKGSNVHDYGALIRTMTAATFGCSSEVILSNSNCLTKQRDCQIFVGVVGGLLGTLVLYGIIHLRRNFRNRLHESPDK